MTAVISTQVLAYNNSTYTYSNSTPFVFSNVSYAGTSAYSTPACSYNTTNGLFTVNYGGVFTINASIVMQPGASSSIGQEMYLNVNGSTVVQGSTLSSLYGTTGGTNGYVAGWLTIDYSFNAGDSFFLEIFLAGISSVICPGASVYSQMGVVLV